MISWQFYWRSWGLQYTKTLLPGGSPFGDVYSHFLIVGPLQLHWYGP